MVVGEKRRFWIPEALAYRGTAGRPQGMLVFDVELNQDPVVAITKPGWSRGWGRVENARAFPSPKSQGSSP